MSGQQNQQEKLEMVPKRAVFLNMLKAMEITVEQALEFIHYKDNRVIDHFYQGKHRGRVTPHPIERTGYFNDGSGGHRLGGSSSGERGRLRSD